MATLTVALTDAAFRFAGMFARGPINSLNGYQQWVGNSSRVEFKATGTGVTMSIVAMTTQPTLRVSVDGGAFSNLTLGSSGVRTDVTLSTGLSDALHTYVVEHSAGTQANAAIEIASAITITGASPAISAPDGYGTQYEACGAAFANLARFHGYPRDLGTSGYPACLNLLNPDASVRFKCNATDIKIWTNQTGGKYRVYQDGTALAAATSAGALSRFGWTTIASSLSGEHEYEIVSCGGTSLQIQTIMLIGGDLTTRPAEKYKLLVIGDSMTSGQGGGASDSSIAYGRLIAMATNRNVVNAGLASSRVVTFQGFGTTSAGTRITEFTRFINPCENTDEIIVLYGYNDAVNQAALADFKAEYKRLINYLISAFPTAKIHCCAFMPTTTSITPITRADYITQISDTVTEISNSNVTHHTMETTDFSPTYNTTAGQDTVDGIHPNASGHGKISTRLQTFISSVGSISSGGTVIAGTPMMRGMV